MEECSLVVGTETWNIFPKKVTKPYYACSNAPNYRIHCIVKAITLMCDSSSYSKVQQKCDERYVNSRIYSMFSDAWCVVCVSGQPKQMKHIKNSFTQPIKHYQAKCNSNIPYKLAVPIHYTIPIQNSSI